MQEVEIKHVDFKSVGGWNPVSLLSDWAVHDSYCCWPALLDFLTIEIKPILHIHTLGHTGSWTFTQTQEKRAHETLKGGPHTPQHCRGKASPSVSGVLSVYVIAPYLLSIYYLLSCIDF